MKVLSLYQPYASLAVFGHKRFETRSWSTKYRGQLAIHATASMPKWCKELLEKYPFNQFGLGTNFEVPHGAIIGTVDLVDVMPVEKWHNEHDLFYVRNRIEKAFGDYSPGRFAWRLENPVRFKEPISAKGMQGFWNFDLSLPH